MTEDEADAKELVEAAALAAALEDGAGDASAPADAVQTAWLLRHSGKHGELEPARGEAILREVMQDAPPLSRPRPKIVRFVPWGIALAAAVVLALLVRPAAEPSAGRARPGGSSTSTQTAAAPTALPRVSRDLIMAQLALTKGASRARFDQEMHAYREQVLHALEAAYPAPLSVLDAKVLRLR